MYEVIDRLNSKVVKLQNKRSSKGYVDGFFPTYNDCYPCLAEFSTRYWTEAWHNEREMEFYKSGDFWLSKQLFISTTLAKSVGKIFLDLEYYSYIQSINISIDNPKKDILYIDVNGINIQSIEFNEDLLNIDFNYILMLNEYLTIHLDSEDSAIIQIKYRIIG